MALNISHHMNYSFNFKQIHIITTTRCNLRCSYCYEENKSSIDADIEKLKQALYADIKACGSNINYLVSFHGGEPFLAFDVVETICDWLWSKFSEYNILVNISTNGTILTSQVKNWIRANRKRAVVVLSLDGLPAVHDKNRDNSFSKIDIDFFREVYKMPFAKMTVPASAVRHMAQGFEYLCNLGFNTSMTIAAEDEYTENDVKILGDQLVQVIEFYKYHNNIPVTEMLDQPLERMSPNYVQNKDVLHRCGIGKFRSAYDVYGNKYPCQTFISDFSTPYDAQEYCEIDRRLKTNWKELCYECRECSIAPLCSTCYGLNYSKRNDISKIDTNFCIVQKLLVKASAYLWTLILTNADYYPWLQDLSDSERKLKLEGILEIQKRL